MKFLIVFCCLWIYFTKVVSAQVVLTEVFPAPSEGDEWIELYNTSDAPISLGGWKIEDNSGQVTTTPTLDGQTLPAQSFLVLEVKNKLNNSGDTVTVKKADHTFVDSFNYTTSTEDMSWARVSFQSTQFVLTSPTKGALNSIPSPVLTPSPTATPSAVPSPLPTLMLSPIPTQHSPLPSPQSVSLPLQMSEISTCPDTGQSEWIEFYNPNPFSVSLQSWKVKDSSGNTRNITLTLPAYGYGTADLSSAIFNNDGDEAHIVESAGSIILSVELPLCSKGESTVYVDGNWVQTKTPTRNAKNIYSHTSLEEDQTTFSSLATQNTTQYGTESASVFFYPSEKNSFLNQNTFETFEATVSASLKPIALPKLMTVSTESSPAAEVETDHPMKELHIPFYFSRPFLISLFVSSFMALAVGGYGVYQWYTERRVEEILETL